MGELLHFFAVLICAVLLGGLGYVLGGIVFREENVQTAQVAGAGIGTILAFVGGVALNSKRWGKAQRYS